MALKTHNAPAAQPVSEADVRLGMLNTLLTTPHRDLGKVFPVHQEMIKQDPLFYVRLAAWYVDTGEIRDHKEMFIVSLALSDFPGHRDVGLAMLRELPPYQVGRVVDFINGKKVKEITTVESGAGKTKKKTSTVKMVDFGLFKNVPRSVVTEVTRYLKEREADADWFDSTAMTARKTLKRLYSLLHVKPGERAQKALFDEAPVEGSSLASVKLLRSTEDPAEQARIIVDNKVPYRIASTVVTAMTPTVLLALISVMSDQELINNLGSLKKRGAMDNADLKALVNERLTKAKSNKTGRVASLKTTTAGNAAGLDEEMQKNLDAVGDAQLKQRGRIKRPTLLLVDKSGSMSQAIELGKRIGSTISTVMDAPLYAYAFDNIPYPLEAKSADLADWEKAFAGIRAGGGTSCGVGIEALRKRKLVVEQIVLVSDEGEVQSPKFVTALKAYVTDLGCQMPHVVFVKCGSQVSDRIEVECRAAGIDYDAYDFKGDYYSLPELVKYLSKSSKLDLLMDIMAWTLPERKAA